MLIIDIRNRERIGDLVDYLNRNNYIGIVKGIKEEHIPKEAKYIACLERKLACGVTVKYVECLVDRFHMPFITIEDLLATEPVEMTISEIEKALKMTPGSLRIKK